MDHNNIAYKIISSLLYLPIIALIYLLDHIFNMPTYLKYIAIGWVVLVLILNILSLFFDSEGSVSKRPLAIFTRLIFSLLFPLIIGIYYLFINYFWTSISIVVGIISLIFIYYKAYSIGKKEVEKKVKLYFTNVLDGSWKQDNALFHEHHNKQYTEKEFIFKNQFKEVANIIYLKNQFLEIKDQIRIDFINLQNSNVKVENLNKLNEKKIKAMSRVIEIEIPKYSNQESEYSDAIRKLEENYYEANKELVDTNSKKIKIMQSNYNKKVQKEIQKKKQEIARLQQEYQTEKETLIEKSNENLDEAINDLKDLMNEKIKNYKKDFLYQFHDNNEEEFSGSKIFERQLEEDKIKEREDKLFKEEINMRISQSNLNNQESIFESKKEFHEKSKELESKLSEEIFQRRQDVLGLQTSVSDLKSYVLNNLNNLKFLLKEGFLKVQESTNAFRLEVDKELNDIKFKWGQDVAALSNNQMKLVNKFESFQVMYDGDKRGYKQQFDGVYLAIDRVAHEAHKYTETVKQTFSNEVLRLKNTDFEMQKNLLLVEANLKQSITKLDSKVDKNALKAEFERERISKKLQHQIERVIDKINLTNSELRFLVKESNYTMKDFVNQNISKIKSDLQAHRSETAIQFERISNRLNISIADIKYLVNQKSFEIKDFTKQNLRRIEKDLQTHRLETNHMFEKLSQKFDISILEIKYLMKEKNYEMKDFVRGNISKMEKDLESFRVQNREQVYELDKKFGSTIKDLAYKFNIKIKDIYHLMNTSDLNIKQLLGKSQAELKAMINNMDWKNEVLRAKSETQWSTRMKDLEIQNERNHVATLQIIQGYKNEMMRFEKKIDSFQNALGKMELQIQKYGIENERVKQDANKLYNDANNILYQITNSIRDFDKKVGDENDKMAIKAKQYMLEAKDIVMQQKNALQQIALGEKGVEMMLNEREEGMRNIQNDVNFKTREIKRIETQGRKDLLSDMKIAELRRQRDESEKALRNESKMASFWKKESNKKPTYSKYHINDFDFPKEDELDW